METVQTNSEKVTFLIPRRVITAIMGFLAVVNAYTFRICLSTAITELTIPRDHSADRGLAVCEPYGAKPTVECYDWSAELQGFILCSFHIGYVTTHIPGVILAARFDAKWTLSLGILSTALFTIAAPYAIITGGPTALIILRILMGMVKTTTFPALSSLLSKWVAAKERGKLATLVLGGGQIVTTVSNKLSAPDAYDDLSYLQPKEAKFASFRHTKI